MRLADRSAHQAALLEAGTPQSGGQQGLVPSPPAPVPSRGDITSVPPQIATGNLPGATHRDELSGWGQPGPKVVGPC